MATTQITVADSPTQSNHGGRQADYAPAPIDVLYELRELRPDLFSQIEVMVDGGVRTGADVVKALALGAKAVGIGRPILYANGTHGEDGVARVLQSKIELSDVTSKADLGSLTGRDYEHDEKHRRQYSR